MNIWTRFVAVLFQGYRSWSGILGTSVRRLVRDRGVWTLDSGKVGITLITIGLTGIVSGVLPNAAVMVTIIGMIVAVRAYLARRADLARLGTAM